MLCAVFIGHYKPKETFFKKISKMLKSFKNQKNLKPKKNSLKKFKAIPAHCFKLDANCWQCNVF